MNSLVGRTLSLFLLGVLAFGHGAQAQRIERVIKANIPFEFSLGGHTFPAGSYSLVSITPALLELRDAQNHCLAKVLTNSVQASESPASPKLQFYSEGGGYALTQVWQEDDLIGQQLQMPKSWTKTAKRHGGHTQTIAVGNSQ